MLAPRQRTHTKKMPYRHVNQYARAKQNTMQVRQWTCLWSQRTAIRSRESMCFWTQQRVHARNMQREQDIQPTCEFGVLSWVYFCCFVYMTCCTFGVVSFVFVFVCCTPRLHVQWKLRHHIHQANTRHKRPFTKNCQISTVLFFSPDSPRGTIATRHHYKIRRGLLL